jgi:hypothetical protein
MGTKLTIDVAGLAPPHRRALEEVIGRELTSNQRLLISVTEAAVPDSAEPPPQSLEDWTRVYDGLSDDEIEQIDAIAKTRANLTRDLS